MSPALDCLLSLMIAAGPQTPETVVTDLLVCEPATRSRRTPVVWDPIEALLARGSLGTPAEGQAIELEDGRSLTWKAIQAEDGRFNDRALRGGWALARVERESAGVLLLDAAGHRRVYVNGTPRAGDIYSLGLVRVPIAMGAGTNELLFRGGRGSLRAKLVEPPDAVYVETKDPTLPDVLRGSTDPLLLGVRVGNATESRREGVTLVVRAAGGAPSERALPPLEPLTVRQFGVRFEPPETLEGDTLEVEVQVQGGHQATFELEVREPHDKHRVTFTSAVDGSVQYYGVTPPLEPVDAPALFLSLHGAGVQAIGQARAYKPKDWGVIVAPTNRRRFGFDWEDWGRLDALEVLEHATARFGTDPRRHYLIGHSMGGHGTWNLGVLRPGAFAAIGPSGGWRDFHAYGGGAIAEELDPIEQLLEDAVLSSRTVTFERNLLHGGVYVLHGEADRNVPVEQARFMRQRLAAFHPNFAYYEEPGAGHVWRGYLDWEPLFRFLGDNRLPEPSAVTRVAFATPNPAVLSRCHWVTIHTQERSQEVSRVDARLDPEAGTLRVESANVAHLVLDLSAFELPGDLALTIDDQEWSATLQSPLHLAREEGRWRVAGAPDPGRKSPLRAGPFKDALRGNMAFVYGTGGDEETRRLNREKARLDAEVFSYRGNGSVDVVADRSFDPSAHPERHVVLYGTADDHGLWGELLGDSPVQVGAGRLSVGERVLEGDDLTVLLVRPHPHSDRAAVAAVASTGPVGQRSSFALPYFVSGVGYADWTVLSTGMLERGSEGILGAGYFGPDWGLGSGRSAWR